MERDLYGKSHKYEYDISTHTLTWSVTLPLLIFNPVRVNFNSHAHVERDAVVETAFPVDSNFNSHAHVERDTS